MSNEGDLPKEIVNKRGLFLVRALDPEGIVAVLENKGNLNTDKEHGETDFAAGYDRFINDDFSGEKYGYGQGGATIGLFVIFPEEAKRLGIEKVTQGSVLGNQVRVGKDLPITPEYYLFAEPSEMPRIKDCKSKAEAISMLGNNRRDIEARAIDRAHQLIDLRKKLSELLGAVPSETRQNRVRDNSKRKETGEIVESDLEDYMGRDSGIHFSYNLERTRKLVSELEELLKK